MKSTPIKINVEGISTGVGYCFLSATKTSVVMSLLFVLTSFPEATLFKLIQGFAGMLFFLVFLGGIITFVVSLIIGVPVTILLVKTGLDDELISSVIGALIVAFYFLLRGDMHMYVAFLAVYAFFCGGAFMKGYKKV